MAGAREETARRYFVSGSVQGVGFRYFTERAATKLKISGFVRNRRDGRVEVYAMGPAEALEALRAELERGPQGALVTSVSEEKAPADAKYDGGFVVEYTAG